jgi:osmoprotectant transport system substrate-binding protein
MNMFTARNKGRLALVAAAVGVSLALAGCGSSTGGGSGDGTDDGDKGTVVVGSQAYYSNEIVAEIYAQALEQAGYTVTRQFQIGQRDAYLPALEGGEVQVFPEYTGNLLQYYDPETTATKADEVYAALADALPESLAVLEQSSATDQDSYNVTQEFADEYSLAGIGDLANVDVPVILGGAPELEERPYGPSGLESVYGVTVQFQATGETTVDSLTQGVINVANVYSADPRIESAGLVTLEDPEGLFLASNVVPLVSADLAEELAEVLDPVSAELDPAGLVAMNVESVDQQKSSADIATEWLEGHGFLD